MAIEYVKTCPQVKKLLKEEQVILEFTYLVVLSAKFTIKISFTAENVERNLERAVFSQRTSTEFLQRRHTFENLRMLVGNWCRS